METKPGRWKTKSGNDAVVLMRMPDRHRRWIGWVILDNLAQPMTWDDAGEWGVLGYTGMHLAEYLGEYLPNSSEIPNSSRLVFY